MKERPPTYLSVREYLATARDWLVNHIPFFHTRWNDGEWICMFRLLSENHRCTRHRYSREICTALRTTHDEIVSRIIQEDRVKILLGSNWLTGGMGSQQYDEYIDSHPGLRERATWCAGDSWYTTHEEIQGKAGDKGIQALIDEVRTGNHRPIVVCNRLLKGLQYCFGAQRIELPAVDGWPKHKEVLDHCLSTTDTDSVFVWCAGFPGKVLSWYIWNMYPQTTHIDLGSLFDHVFNVGVASWTRRRSGPHQAHRIYVEKYLRPYVHSFIPKGANR